MTDPELPLAERLAAALRCGTVLDLNPDTPVGAVLDEGSMRGWDASHDLDAGLVRDLLLGHQVDDPDPRGLVIRGARIQGPLHLNHLHSTIPLYLLDCLLEAGVSAEMARLPTLVFARCRIGHSDLPAAVVADHIHVEGPLHFDGSVVTAAHTGGAVRLHGAQVDGQLSFAATVVRNACGAAVTAELLQAGGHVVFRDGFTARGQGEKGAVCLLGAQVNGQLNLGGAQLVNPTGPALLAESVRIGQSLFLSEGFTAVGSGDLGAVRVPHAQIGGQFILTGAAIRNPSGPALRAASIEVRGDVWLHAGFTAEGTGTAGAVCLDSAEISGMLTLGGAAVRNPSGPAVMADDLHTHGGLFLNEDFAAEGSGTDGAIRLLGAHVDGQAHLGPGYIVNSTGPAVAADGLRTGGSLCFDDGLTAAGVGDAGTVRITGSQVGSQLRFGRVIVHNANGPALVAQVVRTQGQVIFHNGFVAEGITLGATVEFTGATIGGPLRFGHAAISNLSGAALNADRVQVADGLTLGQAFIARGGGSRGAVNLTGTRVGGQLTIHGLGLARVNSRSGIEYRWEIDGLSYTGVPHLPGTTPRRAWLDLLGTKTFRYTAQPYQGLAAAYRAQGHDSDVRAILMAQRRDQIARGDLSWLDRWWGRTTGALLGYGYQPWRALVGLLATVAASLILAGELGVHGGLVKATTDAGHREPGAQSHISAAATGGFIPVEPCTRMEVAQRALDLGMPFLPHADSICMLSSGATGVALTISTWVLRLVAWAMGTLFVAGFTGIVRKT